MPEGSPIRSLNDTELEVLMQIRYRDLERAAARDEILEEFRDIFVVYQELRIFGLHFLAPHHVDVLFNLINHRMEALNEAMTVLDEEENWGQSDLWTGLGGASLMEIHYQHPKSGIADVVTYPSTARSA
ncbi:hypothetical protein N7527_004246 [Penicillium freii]|uniref:Uncharacterized protein n=1 Tax=Penicillium freii TaxID=48697 RepID=A0A117NSI1_PENFR|nr:hypothetical protein N7527_004246 [Penicillium freii]KUM66581.1 hypothetical protein ACN42_g486 [Penicillium freii]